MNDAAKKLKQIFSAESGRAHSAPVDAAVLAPGKERGPTEQINLRVPNAFKKRVRLLAARDGIRLTVLIQRAIEAYEERYGRAPDV